MNPDDPQEFPFEDTPDSREVLLEHSSASDELSTISGSEDPLMQALADLQQSDASSEPLLMDTLSGDQQDTSDSSQDFALDFGPKSAGAELDHSRNLNSPQAPPSVTEDSTLLAGFSEVNPEFGNSEAVPATIPDDVQSSLGLAASDASPVNQKPSKSELPELSLITRNIDNSAPAAPLAVGQEIKKQEAGLSEAIAIEQRITQLRQQEATLRQEIATLEGTHAHLREQIASAQSMLGSLVQEGLKELEKRKQELQISVEQLERRQERIRSEMRTSFAGVSQDLAIRVQSFKDYLVGSLQDLALTAEQLELPKPSAKPSARQSAPVESVGNQSSPPSPKFAEQSFQEQTRKIRHLLDQYRNRPDYYGPAWQLRRTFEPIHAERVSNWFFTQGGRGAIRTMGSRLQNILVSSATVSILYSLYGDRLRALILAESPERLGEWRRGLQDCLGITRSDFGPERGVALFEDPEVLIQKADRAVKEGQIPFIIIDETEEQINLSLLQFPLWLAFAPNPQVSSASNTGSRDYW